MSFREHEWCFYRAHYLLPLTCRGCGCCGLPENIGRIHSSCLRARFLVKLTVHKKFHTTTLDLVHIWMGASEQAKMQALGIFLEITHKITIQVWSAGCSLEELTQNPIAGTMVVLGSTHREYKKSQRE